MLRIKNNKNCTIKINSKDYNDKSAKEMFEELNFMLVENTDDILKYKNTDDAIVEFNKIDKNYLTYWGNREHDFDVYVEEAIVVDFKLHKAINKQIEELGWN